MAELTPKAYRRHAAALKRIEACLKPGSGDDGLDLSHLGLTTLPPEIGQLTALTVVNLRNNRLTTLPPEIGQLTALIFWSRKGLRQRRAGNRKPSGSLLQAYYRDSA